jgi:FkbM family methyltransferase
MFLSDRHAPSLAFVSSFVAGRYEPETKALLETLIREGMTVCDIGAHVGHYTLLAARLVGPRGHVYAFEPEPENYALLKRNVELNGYGNVTCVPKAVSNRSGVLEFYVSRQGNDRHSLIETPSAQAHASKQEVAAITLDEFAASMGWPRIDVIKMDIEGAEPLAIAGMSELLRRSEQLSLVIEFAPDILRAGGADPAGFLNTLRSLGFTIAPVEADVPAEALQAATLQMAEIERRGAINLVCTKALAQTPSV